MLRPIALALLAAFAFAADPPAAKTGTSPYAKWTHGPPTDPAFFPIAVWLQDPRHAERYKEAGITVYHALWDGPTEEQLAALKAAGLKAVCEQNALGLKHLDDPTIIGWIHGDEPDNAQDGRKYKAADWTTQTPEKDQKWPTPIPPADVIASHATTVKADPTRPHFLNLGQGVAYDGWYGRGSRTSHFEDYAEYAKGGDVLSFDIYPVAGAPNKEVKDNLWYVAQGVDRLRTLPRGEPATKGEGLQWTCIETGPIGDPSGPTPAQVRSEVWMALIHGSNGIIYFVHRFKPTQDTARILNDPVMLKAVSELNHQIAQLAPVLNSPTVRDLVTVASANAAVSIDVMAKSHGGALYLFAVAMRAGDTTATFSLGGAKIAATSVEVIGENRTVPLAGGKFGDAFTGYAAHLYKIAGVGIGSALSRGASAK